MLKTNELIGNVWTKRVNKKFLFGTPV